MSALLPRASRGLQQGDNAARFAIALVQRKGVTALLLHALPGGLWCVRG